MQGFLTSIGRVGVVVTCIVMALSFSAQAEKKKITWRKKTTKQMISQTTVYPGDVPNHELVQTVSIDRGITTSDPEFAIIEMVIHAQIDQIAGTGSHRTHSTSFHTNGEKSYVSWEGTHKMVIKEGGTWELPYEGTGQFTGGTGKFKHIKGSATYKGTFTAEGIDEEVEMTVEY
jgi:hypothetical protein